MLEIFLEYGLFLLKVITILISVIVLISFVAASKKSNTSEGLEIENLNEKYFYHQSFINFDNNLFLV